MIEVDLNQPRVSVIVPTKNGARFVRSALASVFESGWSNLEVLVVDGHSTDNTQVIVQAFTGVSWLTQPGRGLADAWNHGIASASSEFIAFLDSDDMWTAGKLRDQMQSLLKAPSLGFVISHFEFFLEPGFQHPPQFRNLALNTAYVGRIPGTLLARRAAFDRLGAFDQRFHIASDVDWFARAEGQGLKFQVLSQVHLLKRLHDVNLSANAQRNSQELIAIFKRSMLERRSRVADRSNGR